MTDVIGDTGQYEIAAYIENYDRERCLAPLLGRPVVWIDDIGPYTQGYAALCSIGSTKRYAYVQQIAEMGIPFATVQHPTARVSPMATVGAGSFINVGAMVATQATIGQHVIINRGVMIGHHTTIADCVTVSPGANVAGAIHIHERAYIGMGAIILERLTIGQGAVVAAGSIVTRDVPERTLVMGAPAKIVKENVEGH